MSVLATDGHVVRECSFIAGHGCGKPWAAWGQYNMIESDKITHWMEMPAPPAEGE